MKVERGSSHGLERSRWAAIGAAVAVSLGAGGLIVASAADSAPASFVAVTPVRVVDSRDDLGVDGPLAAMQSVVVQVTGSVPTTAGPAVVVPSGATAVVMNVTAVQPTAQGFFSVRPGDATGVPSTSSVNFLTGQIVANSLTVQLPVAGNVQVYFHAATGATIHLVIDVVGYYVTGGTGPEGPEGPPGAQGIQGIPGPAGSGVAAEFFALMPSDNSATVGIGTDVDFPQDGPTTDGTITRTGVDTFNLAAIGVYRVSFQVSVTEAGQLVLTLNGTELANTVVGRATGTTQITGIALVETTAVNSILTVRNPSGNSTALSVTPLAGGAAPVSATLIIELVQAST
ncbi:MAG: collagen-like protein [Actinomycetota bacterium]|nr:collagen-like protein [Actinomycetota bacterium]